MVNDFIEQRQLSQLMMMNTLALLLIVQYMYGCTFWDDNSFNQMAVVGPISFNKVI